MLTRKLPLVAASVLLFSTGCDAYYDDFYTTTTTTTTFPMLPNTKTTTTFNSDLPNAVEEVFETCHEPLVISPDTTAWDMGGTCDSLSDLSTTDAQIVWAGLSTLDDVDLSDSFSPSVLAAVTDIYHVDGVFPWPFQNCDVWMDFGDMDVQGIRLVNMNGSWEMSPDGRPALRLHLDNDSMAFATGDIEGDVDCPNPLNEPILQPNVPDGPTDIKINNLDLDIWIDFTFSGSTVTAIADADIQIGSLTISPPLTQAVRDRVGSFQDMVEDFGGVSVDQIELDTAASITSQLGDLEAQMAAMVQSAVPADHHICSITISGGNMILKTAKNLCL